MKYFIFVLICCFQGTTSGADDIETTSSLLRQAIRHTTRRNFTEAERCYQRMCELDPIDGLPALARFLYLTGQTTRTQSLLETTAIQTAPPIARARVVIEGGLPEQAIRILQEPSPAGHVYRQTVLLANQLEVVNRSADAGKALAAAIAQPELTPLERIDILKKLTRLKDCSALATGIPVAASALVTSSTLDFQLLRPVLWDAVMSLSSCEDFASFHHTMKGMKSSISAWLDALASIRRGDARAAYETLQAAIKRVQSSRERGMLMEELAMLSGGDIQESLRLREEMISASAQPDRLHLDSADLSMRLGDFSNAMRHLQATNSSNLDDEQKSQYIYVRLAAMAKLEPAVSVIDEYASATRGMKWNQLRSVAEAPFEKLERTEVVAMREAALTRLGKPDASPQIYAVLLTAEHHLESQEGMLAAVAGYAAARPNDAAAQEDLATVSASLAATLGQVGGPGNDVKPTADKAAQALWKIIEAKPYEPESYGKLMELYRFFGEPDKVRRVPQYLCSATTAPAEAIALAAYIYATNGMPEEAVPLYERAQKVEPGNAKFRLNYAGALTRIGKLDAAEAIFQDLIRRGADGHQYHTHELYAAAWELALQRKALPEFIDFLKALMNDAGVPQRDVFLLDAGKLLMRRDHAKDSLSFFDRLATEFPSHAADAQEQLVEAYVALKDFDAAEKQVASMEKQSTDPADLLRAQYNMGILRSARGDVDGAVTIWKQIAARNPRDKSAGRSLLAAAQTLREARRRDEAKSILENYLAADTGDTESEAGARELIEQMRKEEAARPDGGKPPNPSM